MSRTRWVTLAACLSIPLVLAGCSSEEERADEVVYDEYGTTRYASYEEGQRFSGGPRDVLVTLDGPAEAYAGQEIDFAVRVHNNTDMTATEVQIEAVIAPELQLVDAPDARWNESGRTLVWHMTSLPPGAEAVLHFRAVPTTPGRLENCVDLRRSFGICAVTDVVAPRLECEVLGETRVEIGVPFQVRLLAHNTGNGTAKDVIGHLDLSSNLRLLQETRPVERPLPAEDCPPGAFGEEYEQQPRETGALVPRGDMTIRFGDIPEGQSVERVIGLVATAPGIWHVGLALEGYPNLQTRCQLEGETLAAQIQVEKVGPGVVYIGQEIAYRIRVSSVGSAPARNVVLTDRLPEATRFVSASGDGTPFDQDIRWSLGDLAPGQTREVTFVLRAFREGVVENCVVANAAGGLRDEACARTEIFAAPAMAIENVDVVDPVEVGAATTYRIRVANEGDRPVTGVVVHVELPEGSEFVQGHCELSQCRYEAQRTAAVFEPIGRMQPGEALEFNVTVRFNTPGDKVCSAVLTFNEFSKPVRSEEGTTVFGAMRRRD